MNLVVHELTASGISQKVIPSERTNVVAIRPHIYRHLFPAGSLKVQILDSASVVVAESALVPISSIETANYFHGYIRFDVNAYLQKNTEYTIKLVGDGYTFAESAYVGWCGGFDLGKYPANYVPTCNLDKPLDVEIWKRTEK